MLLIYLKKPFNPVMANINFQKPFIQSSVLHDHSEIIIIC